MRTASLLAAVAFAWFTSLQFNDPDPVPWIAVYGIASAACALVALRRPLPWTFFAFYSLVCAGWAGTLVARVEASGTTWAEVLDVRHGMLAVGFEEGREAAGLLIVTVWMGTVAAWRRTAAPSVTPQVGR